MAALSFFATTATAAPRSAPNVGYTLSTTATTVDITVRDGSVGVANGIASIRNLAGREVFRLPLTYRMETHQFPIDARTVGKTLTLTPSKNLARSTPVNPIEVEAVRVAARTQVDAPTTRQERDDAALGRLLQTISAGMTISSLVGLALGAVAGGVIGCALGLSIGGFGCLPAIPFGASIGSIIGTILGGGGTVVLAGIQYLQTITSPFVPGR
ncbi:glycine zipper family protein [Gordonia sp. ABSL1-1]|uniref:glycine zipper family protein n=1 Tax=Gordonia sp. ABSL1-1 TaxID=3053923 RepID=UPI002572BA11|nr:glycine zipper family protein [Gordonia sp. ABSL1-1]MDL9938595.1 glycine zipper family protein [Gordonia sp. ABSL1-1]